MKNIIMIIKYTFREVLAKKIMITYLIISALAIVGTALGFYAMGDNSGIANIKVTEKTINSEINREMIIAGIKFLEVSVTMTLFLIGLFLSIFSTAGLIPDLLKKGNIDLFLSKPISKFQLMVGKYLGAVLIVFINIVFLVGSIWFLIGMKFSYWDTSFLFSIFTITFVYAAIYALMTLIAVLTKSSVLPMIISFLIIIVVNPILNTRENLYGLFDNSIFEYMLDGLYYLIPQSTDIVKISQDSILGAEIIITPIFTTACLLIVYFSLSIYFFKKKDF